MSSVVSRQAEPAEGDALRCRVPLRVADPQRLEEARPQVVDERRAAHLLDDGGEHVARRRVVDEVRAGLVGHGQGQEGPRLGHVGVGEGELLDHVRVVAGRHRQQVPHPHRLQVLARLGRRVLGEEGEDGVVEAQLPLGDREADARGREALAEREEHVRVVAPVRPPPALGHDVAVAQHHEAVQRVDALLGGLDEAEDRATTGCPGPRACCAAAPSARQRRSRRRRAEEQSISWPRIVSPRGQVLNCDFSSSQPRSGPILTGPRPRFVPMARPLRIEFPGALYHVTSRGNARAPIFLEDRDRRQLLRILSDVVERYRWVCHAYCLMTNHYHLLVETPEANLSRGMRQLNGLYTQRFNRAHERVGHILQGRFGAVLVERDAHLLELARYVVLNPVRAGMVAAGGGLPVVEPPGHPRPRSGALVAEDGRAAGAVRLACALPGLRTRRCGAGLAVDGSPRGGARDRTASSSASRRVSTTERARPSSRGRNAWSTVSPSGPSSPRP